MMGMPGVNNSKLGHCSEMKLASTNPPFFWMTNVAPFSSFYIKQSTYLWLRQESKLYYKCVFKSQENSFGYLVVMLNFPSI